MPSLSGDERSRRRFDAGAGGERFNGCVRIVGEGAGSQMSDLRDGESSGSLRVPVDDQSSADAGADSDIEDCAVPASRAVGRFGQRGDVAVVAQTDWNAKRFTRPFDNWEVGPTFDLMARDDSADRRVDRTAEAVTDPFNRIFAEELASGFENLFANGVRAARAFDSSPFQRDQRRTVTSADSQLQFRAADFDAEKHG